MMILSLIIPYQSFNLLNQGNHRFLPERLLHILHLQSQEKNLIGYFHLTKMQFHIQMKMKIVLKKLGYHAEVLPQEHLNVVEELHHRQRKVLFFIFSIYYLDYIVFETLFSSRYLGIDRAQISGKYRFSRYLCNIFFFIDNT